jgi:hypothetical protein
MDVHAGEELTRLGGYGPFHNQAGDWEEIEQVWEREEAW